jgi:hypothetical protein
MAARKPAKPVKKFRFGWRGPLVFILTAFGVISLLGFMFAHWTDRQVLTTDNWVKIVGPLPKDDTVATALSQYSVERLFAGVDVEGKITQALPDKAVFLAPTLTERLEVRTEQVTKNLIQSDTFESIWTVANRTAHQKLMDAARSDAPAASRATNFEIKLDSLKDRVRERLGKSSDELFNDTSSKTSSGSVNLNLSFKTKFENFKKFVRTIDFLNATLGLVALAALLGAIVLTLHRRRLLMVISLSMLVITLLQLIGINAVRPAVLNHIQNEAFRPAAGVVYDNLLVDFRRSATVVGIVSALVLLVAYLTKPKFIKRSKMLSGQLRSLKRSNAYSYWMLARIETHRLRLFISGGVIIIGLALMALAFKLDWEGIIRSVLVIIIVIELVLLFAKNSYKTAKIKKAAS